ncbi:MAG: hypothetical protein AVDCRST_MAG66-4291 [uncultured Pseudonocardia sp.]|uniref:Uncharacterized protein n=1 Tax=uncultured Pseudonocardia sp. TaxID=211455 RepID=A0A6J4QMT0_9PSEU|nr:MAG: hypothetical protein AVDCRST_MAG66-4291 [uncultured Pseudonocardia sp.]
MAAHRPHRAAAADLHAAGDDRDPRRAPAPRAVVAPPRRTAGRGAASPLPRRGSATKLGCTSEDDVR